MIDYMDAQEAAGAYRDAEYERWLDQMAEEFAILDDIETAARAEKDEISDF